MAALLPQPALPGASADDADMFPAGDDPDPAGHIIEGAEVDEHGFFWKCNARYRASAHSARLMWLYEIAAWRSLADFRDDIVVAEFLRQRLRSGAAAQRAAARAEASALLRRLRAVRGAPLKRAKAVLRSSRRRRTRNGSRAPPAGAAGSGSADRHSDVGCVVEAAKVDERDMFLASYDRYCASVRAARDTWLLAHAAWARCKDLHDDLSFEEADRRARRKGRAQRAAALAESVKFRVALRGVRRSYWKRVLSALGPPLPGSERFSRLL